MRPFASATVLAFVGVAVASCAKGVPPESPFDLPQDYSRTDERTLQVEVDPTPMGSGGEATPDATAPVSTRPVEQPHDAETQWWLELSEPELDRLIAEAIGTNLDLRTAIARVAQARELSAQALALRLPRADLSGRASASSSVNSFLGSRTESQSLSASLPVSYEVDLFGRYAHQHHAARFDAQAADHDLRSAIISLSAQVAETYFDLVALRARRALLSEQQETNKIFHELVLLRFQQGAARAVDVHQQRQQVASLATQLLQLQTREPLRLHQIALLVGRPSSSLAAIERQSFPELPPAPDPGVPATLLRNRPDIYAAGLRLNAADHRVSATIAERLPAIRLSFAPGYGYTRSQRTDDTMSPLGNSSSHGWSYDASASLSMPIFDGGLAKARMDAQKTALEQSKQAYAQAILRGLVEVETALAREAEERALIGALEAQIRIAEETLEAARERYAQGDSDFLPVLTALQGKQQLEGSRLDAQRRRLSARIQLYRALGGTWPRDVDLKGEAS